MNLKNYFYNIQYNLKEKISVRTVFVLMLGTVLFLANITMFIIASIYGFGNYNIIKVSLGFCFGLIGVLFSSVLIFMLSLEFAFPQKPKAPLGGAPFQTALKKPKKEKIINLIVLILVYIFIWGGGFASVGYYISQEVGHSYYKTIEAVVVDMEQDATSKWYPIYEYIVDGVTYKVKGDLNTSGLAATGKGDKVIIKYDPQNPSNIINSSENIFFLLFGMFFIYIGILLLLYELNAKGFLKQEFFLSFIMAGIGLVASLGAMVGKYYLNIISLLADNLWIFFVAMFINAGIMEFIGGVVWLGHNRTKEY